MAASCLSSAPDAKDVAAPRIVDISVSSITQREATLSGTISGAKDIIDCGFVLNEVGESSRKEIPAERFGDEIRAEVTGLRPNCNYEFMAYVGNGSGARITSGIRSFSTLPVDPSMQIEFEDENFLAWVLWNYDSDKDGYLSLEEGTHVLDIDVNTDNIHSIAPLYAFPNLSSISCSGTRVEDYGLGQLTSLDFTGVEHQLGIIYAPHNKISKLILPERTDLIYYIGLCINKFTEIDVRSCKNVQIVDVSFNNLRTFDCTGMDALDELHLDSNPLEEVTLDSKSLRYLNLNSTLVGSLDFSHCPKLNTVDCTNCPNLKTIYLAKGQVVGTLSLDEGVTLVYYD